MAETYTTARFERNLSTPQCTEKPIPKRLLHSHRKWNATGDARDKQLWGTPPAGHGRRGTARPRTAAGRASLSWAPSLHAHGLTRQGTYHTVNNTEEEDTQPLGVQHMQSGKSVSGARNQ